MKSRTKNAPKTAVKTLVLFRIFYELKENNTQKTRIFHHF